MSVDKVSSKSSICHRYRAAELKHGRIAMLAALGQITQYYVRLGDPVFNQVTWLGPSKKALSTIVTIISDTHCRETNFIPTILSGRQTFQSIPAGYRGEASCCCSNSSCNFRSWSLRPIQPGEGRSSPRWSWVRSPQPQAFWPRNMGESTGMFTT